MSSECKGSVQDSTFLILMNIIVLAYIESFDCVDLILFANFEILRGFAFCRFFQNFWKNPQFCNFAIFSFFQNFQFLGVLGFHFFRFWGFCVLLKFLCRFLWGEMTNIFTVFKFKILFVIYSISLYCFAYYYSFYQKW